MSIPRSVVRMLGAVALASPALLLSPGTGRAAPVEKTITVHAAVVGTVRVDDTGGPSSVDPPGQCAVGLTVHEFVDDGTGNSVPIGDSLSTVAEFRLPGSLAGATIRSARLHGFDTPLGLVLTSYVGDGKIAVSDLKAEGPSGGGTPGPDGSFDVSPLLTRAIVHSGIAGFVGSDSGDDDVAWACSPETVVLRIDFMPASSAATSGHQREIPATGGEPSSLLVATAGGLMVLGTALVAATRRHEPRRRRV